MAVKDYEVSLEFHTAQADLMELAYWLGVDPGDRSCSRGDPQRGGRVAEKTVLCLQAEGAADASLCGQIRRLTARLAALAVPVRRGLPGDLDVVVTLRPIILRGSGITRLPTDVLCGLAAQGAILEFTTFSW